MDAVIRQPHRELCSICQEVSRVGFFVPNEVYEAALHPSQTESIVCLACFTRLADERQVQWDAGIEFHPVSLVTLLHANGWKRGSDGDE